MSLTKEEIEFLKANDVDVDSVSDQVGAERASKREDEYLQAASKVDEVNTKLAEIPSRNNNNNKSESSVTDKAVDVAGKAVTGAASLVTQPVTTAKSIGQGMYNGTASFANFIGDVIGSSDRLIGDLASTDIGKKVAKGLNTDIVRYDDEGLSFFQPKNPDYNPEEDGFFTDDTVNFGMAEFVSDNDQTWAHQMVEGISQFALGVKGIDKVSKLSGLAGKINLVKQAGGKSAKAAGLVEWLATNGVADMAAFDETEPRFFDMVKQMGIENGVVDYLASNPKDTNAENRLKQFLEGVILGGAIEGVLGGPKAARNLVKSISDYSGALRSKRYTKSVIKDAIEVADKVTTKLDNGGEVVEADLKRTKPTDEELNERISLQERPIDKEIREYEKSLPNTSKLKKKSLPTGMVQRKAFLDDFDANIDKIQKVTETKFGKAMLSETAMDARVISDLDTYDFKKMSTEDFVKTIREKFGIENQEFIDIINSKKELMPDPNEYIKDRVAKYIYMDEVILPKVSKLGIDYRNAEGELRESLKRDFFYAFKKYMDANNSLSKDVSKTAQILRSEKDIQVSRSKLAREAEILTDLQKTQGFFDDELAEKFAEVAVKNSSGDIDSKGFRGFVNSVVNTAGKPFSDGKLVKYYYMSLLSNIKTSMVAFTEGAFVRPLLKTAQIVPATINQAVGRDGIRLNELSGYYKAYGTQLLPSIVTAVKGTFSKTHLQEAIKKVPEGFVKTKIDDDIVRLFSNSEKGGIVNGLLGVLDIVAATGARGLRAADVSLSQLHYNAGIREEAIRAANRMLSRGDITKDQFKETVSNFLENPEPYMLSRVKHNIERATLTEKFKESQGTAEKFVSKLEGAIDSNQASKIMVPFFNVGANITREALKHTPIRIGRVWTNWDKLTKAQRDEQVTEVILGTSIMGLFSYGYSNGVITGARPSDFRSTSSLPPDWQPHAVKVNGKYISIEKFGVLANLMKASVAIQESIDRANYYQEEGFDKQVTSMYISAFYRGFSGIASPSMLVDTFTEVASMVDGGLSQEELENFVSKKLVGFVPASSAARQVRQWVDPVSRQKLDFDSEEDRETFLKNIMDISPFGHSKMLPPRLDIFGEEIRNDMPLAYQILSPLRGSDIKDEKLSDKMVELGFTQGEILNAPSQGNVLSQETLSFPTRSISFNGFNVKLSPEQYNRRVRLSSGHDLLNHPFKGTEYDGMTFKQIMSSQIELGFPLAEKLVPQFVPLSEPNAKVQRRVFKQVYGLFKKAANAQIKKEYEFELTKKSFIINEMEKNLLN